MSTIERVNKQIKALAANSKFLTSIINENEIAQIQKNVDLLKCEQQSSNNDTHYSNCSTVYYSDKEMCFDSMLQLTNFILYNDYPNETNFISKRKYLQTSRCDYNLTKSDLKEIDTFAKELDTIETDLADIQANLKSYRKNYLIYCENLMRFIDQKELLMNMFLNYYDEYFLRKQSKPAKKSRHASDNTYSNSIGLHNKKQSNYKKSNKRGSTNNLNNSSHVQTLNHQKVPRKHKRNSQDGYISDDSGFASPFTCKQSSNQNNQTNAQRNKLRHAKSTTIYVSSIPTENRFALLANKQNNNNKTKS